MLMSYLGFVRLQDYPKLNRCTELLSMNEELKQARKAFETDEEKLRKAFEADDENRLASAPIPAPPQPE